MQTPWTLLACVALLAALPSAASAQGGGAAAPSGGGSQQGGGGGSQQDGRGGSQAGGVSFGAPVPGKEAGTKATRRPARRKRRGATLLTSFELPRKHVYLHGRPARIRFTLSGRRAVHVRLRVLRAVDRAPVATIDLGERAPGEHTAAFTGLETGAALAEGTYLLRLAGRGLRRAPTASSTAGVEVSHYAFPIAGTFDWGGEGSRFGARRHGHSHQGQDLTAAEGTPVVAPRGGLVEVVQYQAAGAGHYVVLDADHEDHDYVFMHLRTGSITVQEGDRVRTGQAIGAVGNTGSSTGPHLHFEIWVGGWYTGGAPIDPLPLLQSWAPAV
jgi:murein DD-endopeptidase MepM/ murein hydrolase activator NlpD